MKVPRRKLKVLLVGDSCYDTYHSVVSFRDNPESDAPLVQRVSSTVRLGMAGNVKTCLENLCIEVIPILPDTDTFKVRYIDRDSGRQLLRVDMEEPSKEGYIPKDLNISKFDAVVISDYDKGFVSHNMILQLQDMAWCTNIPVFLDTKKKHLDQYTDCILKINTPEFESAHSLPPDLIMTEGAGGALDIKASRVKHYPALRVECKDVCGAGDAFLAGLVYGTLNKFKDPISYAIVNAGLSVEHIGTYAPTTRELNRGIIRYASQLRNS